MAGHRLRIRHHGVTAERHIWLPDRCRWLPLFYAPLIQPESHPHALRWDFFGIRIIFHPSTVPFMSSDVGP